MTRRAAIYCRISKTPKAELDALAAEHPGLSRRELADLGGSLGVTRQEKKCREMAADRRWEIIEVFSDDDRSAYDGKPRPGFDALCLAIKDGEIDAVLAFSPSRLIRHPRTLEDFIDLLDAQRVEVATHLAGDYDLSTSGGRLVARVVGAVARHESEEKSERLVLKMEQLASGGHFHGGKRPFGYEADGVTIRDLEADAIRLAASWVLEGVGLRRIAQELNAREVPTAQGHIGTWVHSVIRKILLAPRIAGLAVYKGEIVGPGNWDPILDRQTWDDVVAILGDPHRKKARPGSGRYLLTGLIVNEKDDKLNGTTRTKGGRVYRGPGITIPAQPCDDFVTEYVLAETDKASLPLGLEPKGSSEVEGLESELAELARLRGEGEISLAEWMAAKKPLDRRLEEARSRVPAQRAVPTGVAAALGTKGGLRAAWPSLTDEERRRAVAEVIEKVTILAQGHGGAMFDPTDRIRITDR
jgi:site-specific DNA recombinase